MSAPWPLAALLAVRRCDEEAARCALAEACVALRLREADRDAHAADLGRCRAERAVVERAPVQPGPAAALRSASALVGRLREREERLRRCHAAAAQAREEAARAVEAARGAVAAARRARELLEARREAFVRARREALVRAEEAAGDDRGRRFTPQR